ncbi:hypothetical protein EXU48_20290 [Occultella glacieicola]|uniref:Uncharacterized protein n=1 Tax=Occultella glacieicola TaxID=2518684 RepID=A0ABY2DYQ2_9MICO|nr:hypothetical protein [Occultella glacieicola]TDE89508.1 hypothetical protein EXU48_20290 [Occultella glacieicola]
MADPDGSTVIREERSVGDGAAAGVGEVTLAAGEPERPAHRRVAAAKAWLAVATSQPEGAETVALDAAERGLAELGDAYLAAADETLEDDTTLKHLAAQELRDQGSEHAATAMTRVLESRIELFDQGRGRAG